MKNKKKSGFFGRIGLAVFATMAAAYIAFLAASVVQPDFTTETALYKSVTDEITTLGWFFREESLLVPEGLSGSYVLYEVDEGGRVATGGLVATLYSTREDAAAAAESVRLIEAESRLETMLARPVIGIGEVEEIDSSVYEEVRLTAESIESGNVADAIDSKEEIAYLLARRQLATDGTEPAALLLEETRAEISAVSAGISQAGREIESQTAGTFTSVTDGYEEIFDPTLCGELSPDELRALASTAPSSTSGALGRVASSYEWRFVCIVPKEQADTLTEGRSYELRFGGAPSDPVSATLEDIYTSPEDEYVLTFLSSVATDITLTERQQSVTITRRTYDGLSINNQSRRVVDGVTGVYVFNGMEMDFKPIEVVYTTDTFTIVEWSANSSGALKLYDEVVVNGKDLYDGKVVN